jgi:AcrR family transcriptional regulator
MGEVPSTQDHRRAAAERSVQAILDAAERLLAAGGDASTSAVASAAGVSRVTLYSHFPTRADLLGAVAERVISESAEAIEAATLTEGPAEAALDRLIDTAWARLAAIRPLFAAARRELPNSVLVKAHKRIDAPIMALIERGRAANAFRTDVPDQWLLATYYALMHAFGDEVTAGRIPASAADSILKTTIQRAFRP